MDFLDEVEKSRQALKGDRKEFWKANKENFEDNIRRIVRSQELPKDWKVYFIASEFFSDEKIMPYDYDAWSNTNLIGATEKQGFEIMVFLNKAKSFLSVPALMPLVVHELAHVKQATSSPEKHANSALDDESARELEIKAEEKKRKIVPKECISQKVLESITYCYDTRGWEGATKMTEYLAEEKPELYSGGYDKIITKEQRKALLKAKKKEDINIFIDFFRD